VRGHELLDKMELVSPAYVEAAEQPPKNKKAAWLRWAPIAACICILISLPILIFYPAETPQDTMAPSSPGDGPPNLVKDGIVYYISSYLSVTEELPEGFVYAGEADVGGFENCPYYVNPEMPEWIYVCQEVRTDGTVDATGTMNPAEPHDAYVRYVDELLRGRDLVCYNGMYYISLWSAKPYGNNPDVTNEYYDAMQARYGIRVEGEAPEGFVCAGVAEFTGYDTVPRGTLASNQGADEIYVNPDEPDILLVSTQWYTAPQENGETRHEGFDVYIRYDCPLA